MWGEVWREGREAQRLGPSLWAIREEGDKQKPKLASWGSWLSLSVGFGHWAREEVRTSRWTW
jgi:hypothetical protein